MAVTVTLVGDATLGAVNRPLGEMLPLEADQVTPVFEVLLTLAENCCVAPAARLIDLGATEIETARGGSTETEA